MTAMNPQIICSRCGWERELTQAELLKPDWRICPNCGQANGDRPSDRYFWIEKAAPVRSNPSGGAA